LARTRFVPPVLSAVIKCQVYGSSESRRHGGMPVENEHLAGRRKMDLDEDSGYESNDTVSPCPSPGGAFVLW
jgi:hypothetical protein